MVSRTPNRSYPYPECDPPEVKDRSDISFLRDAAEAIDADAQAEDDQIAELLERPDSARVSFAGNTSTATGFLMAAHVPYDTVSYDNTTGGITDLTAGGIRVVERGWYVAASYVRFTGAGAGISASDLSVAHARNGSVGADGRRFEGPASEMTAAGEMSMTTSDMIYCDAGDIIQTQWRIQSVAGGGAYAYEARLSVSQLFKLDI